MIASLAFGDCVRGRTRALMGSAGATNRGGIAASPEARGYPRASPLEGHPMREARTSQGSIEYRLVGSGPVVMVLKGGHSSRSTRLGHERLAEHGFSVLEPSRPGYDGTPRSVGCTAQRAADALVDLLDELGIRRVSLVAISAAGHTGIELARRHPDSPSASASSAPSRCRGVLASVVAGGSSSALPKRSFGARHGPACDWRRSSPCACSSLSSRRSIRAASCVRWTPPRASATWPPTGASGLDKGSCATWSMRVHPTSQSTSRR